MLGYSLYRNNLKNRDFGKEGPQNLHSEEGTIAERQGPSENANSELNPTCPKTNSSGYFGISFYQEKLLYFFVALGPLGSLLTPPGLPKPFRVYYFLLPLFPLFFFRAQRFFWQACSIFSPFFLYCFVSCLLAGVLGVFREEDQLARCCLFFSHFYFVIGAAARVAAEKQIENLIRRYVCSFFLILGIGYFFFIGYYLRFIPLDLIERFSILTQFGYGLLRFSPGSYPNEFGILSSFVLSVLVLMSCTKRAFFLPYHILGTIFTLGALLLSTTRAAYLAFGMSLLYLCRDFFQKIVWVVLAILGFLFFLTYPLKFSLVLKVLSAFLQKIDEGSLGERYFAWQDGWRVFQEHIFWGAGFGSFPQLHNVYLSFLFELGLFGALLLCVVLGVWKVFLASVSRDLLIVSKDRSSFFVSQVQMLGLIHVFWFAASNHNLHHHLTWFVFFLYFSLRKLQMSIATPLQSHPKRAH